MGCTGTNSILSLSYVSDFMVLISNGMAIFDGSLDVFGENIEVTINGNGLYF